MSKLVVFDIDGTILNSKDFFKNIILEYSEKNNLLTPCVKNFYEGYANPDAYDIGWGVSKEEQRYHVKKTIELAEERTAESIPSLYSGVEETLSNLKDLGHTLSIITSRDEKSLIEVMEYHNVYTLFSSHRSRCDVERRSENEKPASDMLHSVMKELSFVPDETVMIGDTTMDVEMGRNAKTGTIGVTWGYHPKEMLEKANAHYIIETEVSDIIPVIGMDFK